VTEGGAVWTDLGDGIRVRQSRAFHMNSIVLLDRQHTVIADPGVLPAELDDIAAVVRREDPAEVTLFFTHAHWDHVLGRPWWPGARTLAHDRFAGQVRQDEATIGREAQALAERHGERWQHPFAPFRPDLAVSGLHFLPLGPWRLVLRDAPGHCAHQLSCHLPGQRLLIAADMLSDIEPPILDGPCAPYRQTLDALRVLAEHGAIETIVPGHGGIARGQAPCIARLRRDLEYLAALEDAVRRAAERGASLAEAQQELAAMDYTGRGSTTYPTDSFHLENIALAYQGVSPSRC
jgi:hydroxyacylglutathione hydrolase